MRINKVEIKDFFQSSNEEINYDETENIFLTKRQKGKGFIKLTFNPDKDGNQTDKTYSLPPVGVVTNRLGIKITRSNPIDAEVSSCVPSYHIKTHLYNPLI